MIYSRLLKLFSKGDDVLAVKKKLVELGYLSKATHNVYGTDTYRAVKAFQSANNLEVDGIVGPLTWAIIFSDDSDNEPIEAVKIPGHISKNVADAISKDLSNVSDIRRRICLNALEYAVDPASPGDHMRCFYVRGGNLYDKDLSLHVMTQSRLKSYFSKASYDPYYNGGRKEIIEAQALKSGYTIPGADCSGTVIGLWRSAKVVGCGTDATANSLRNSYCTDTSKPVPGDLAWRGGHIGLYVGGGYVAENIGGAYGLQLTKVTKRRAYNFQDKKMHTFDAWVSFGDPKVY